MRVWQAQELTSAVLVAQVREPPDVGEVHGEPDDGEQEVHLARPGLAHILLGASMPGPGAHGRHLYPSGPILHHPHNNITYIPHSDILSLRGEHKEKPCSNIHDLSHRKLLKIERF